MATQGRSRVKTPLWRSLVILGLLILMQPLVWWYVGVRAIAVQQAFSIEEQLAELVQRNSILQQNLNTQETYLDQLAVVAPARSELAQIVERLEMLADENNLSLEIDTIAEVGSERRRSSVLIPVQVDVSLTGDDSNVLFSYLEHVEHIPELTTVTDWNMDIAQRVQPPPTVGEEQVVETTSRLDASILFFLQDNRDG